MSKWPGNPVALALFAAFWAGACGGNGKSSVTSPTPVSTTSANSAGGPGGSPPGSNNPEMPIGSGTAVVVAIGDVGWCGSVGLPLTAKLLQAAGMNGQLILAGDLAYMNGRLDEFNRCFDPDFGRFRSRWRPVPGNHEWDGGMLGQGYFAYFGDSAGAGRRGFYSFKAATWLVLMLNSSAPVDARSEQYLWARDEIRANPTRCTMAVWHHPFASSGPNGPTAYMREMWQLLVDNNAEVVISAHDHFYERFAPQTATYQPDLARGLRQFIAGTGGAPLYSPATRFPNSEVIVESFGALKLTLDPAGYEWEFTNATTTAVADRGVGHCH
jgi:acid phosphatase type 7